MRAIGRAIARLPIRLRLIVAFGVVLVLLFGGLALALHQRFSASLDEGIDQALRTRASDLATLVHTAGGDGLPSFHEPLPESGGTFAQILDREGRVVDATPGHQGDPLLSAAQVRRALAAPLSVSRVGESRLLAESLRTTPATVLVVGESLSERDRALGTLSDLLFIGGPALLLLTLAAGYALTAGALRPVERMRSRAEKISGEDRGERLPLPEAPDELRRLGETLNEMLERLEEAIHRERSFVAQAGHELRTPLSVLKLELDLAIAEKPSGPELDSMLRSSAKQVERLVRLAESLLMIARGEEQALQIDLQPVDIGRLIASVVETMKGPADGLDRELRVERDGELLIEADPDRVERALLNLLANSLTYGDGTIVVRVEEEPGEIELHVLDEGPGFDPRFLPVAFERFAQADPDASGRRGFGLGLAIVRLIAEAHGGSVGAVNRPGGGADVWISLPRENDAPAGAEEPRGGRRRVAP
ncbi:MAG TPA: ATP-binding protein [Solirubrobacterales bacterium]|nr:ATP-binding protein [Solirubrobacterales bacterium]